MNKQKMKISLFIVHCSLLILLVSDLHARGRADTEDPKTINDEWLLCVTAFDLSALPPARRIAGEVLARDLVSKLHTINYRQRVSPEYAFYEGYAWRQSVLTTARALSSKQDERAMMIFRGDPEWRYKRNLKRVDDQIEKLMEELNVKELERPVVNRQPVFGLVQANYNASFPEPPQPGGEFRFCRAQTADAFLTGEIREFHGRFYIRLRLYTLYTQSFVYEDDVIFSMDDAAGAVDEIAGRLTALISGNKPAALTVTASPPEAQILINQNYAGTGTSPTRERPPGLITVAVTAEGYKPESEEVELTPGEHIAIEIELSPLQYAEVNIGTQEEGSVVVYEGALFKGFAPYALQLPIDQLAYVTLEQRDGKTASAVFTAPEYPGESYDISLLLKDPFPAGEKRVNKARSRAYWAWGSVWLTLISTWIVNGIYSNQVEALSANYSDELYAKYMVTNAIRIGSFGLVGAAITYNLIQMPRYIRTSSEKAVPIVKQEKEKKKK